MNHTLPRSLPLRLFINRIREYSLCFLCLCMCGILFSLLKIINFLCYIFLEVFLSLFMVFKLCSQFNFCNQFLPFRIWNIRSKASEFWGISLPHSSIVIFTLSLVAFSHIYISGLSGIYLALCSGQLYIFQMISHFVPRNAIFIILPHSTNSRILTWTLHCPTVLSIPVLVLYYVN